VSTALAGTEHQPHARITLEAALRGDGLTHAYLFHGPPGTGKREAARAFAASLIAEGAPDHADAERRVHSGVHPDLTWIEPRGAHDVLVDDVRTQVVRQAALRPFESSRRVFVIAEADRMNDESQNTLLKTLEEPAPFAHMVLVSSAPGRLLPTIVSRLQPVRFGPVPAARIAELLEAEGVEPRTALACARLAGGNATRARYLASEDGAAQRAEAEHAARATLARMDDAQWVTAEAWRPLLDRAAKAGAAAEAAVKRALEERLESEPTRGRGGFVREYELQGRRARRRAHTASLDLGLELVSLWFRDLVAVTCGREAQAFNLDRAAELAADAGGRDAGRLIDSLELCEDCRRRLERNVLEDLALEALFSRLRRAAAPGTGG
jgi:DNA polymerase III subunit delta'